jgi:hypothetical protein
MALNSLSGTDLNKLLGLVGTAQAGQVGAVPASKETDQSGDAKAATGGQATGDTAEISPRVQVQLLQVRLLYEATYQVSQETGSIMGAGDQSRQDFNAQLADILAGHAGALTPGEDGTRPLDKLAAMFTPEATAGRIFDFATSWYGQWLKGGADTADNRQAFADFIGGAVEKGFTAAQGQLGKLPDEVQGGIDKTHELVQGMFKDFVQNGLTKSSDELAAAQQTGQAFNATFSAASADPASLMREVLDRLSADGTLRLDSPPQPTPPGSNLELTA